MTPDPIPLRAPSMLECRNCGAGVPLDDHFCGQCDRILALGRHGDYFSFLGFPRRLSLDAQTLERRFRELSRKFHPDYFYNSSPTERLASLERSSYLNDAYRTLRNPAARIEHLLAIEGLPPAKSDEGGVKVPPALLEEVFELNEELDQIRESREEGGDRETLRRRLDAAREPIDRKRVEHERQIAGLMERWDAQSEAQSPERKATLEALRERLFERKYIDNLIATIEREAAEVRPDTAPIQPTGKARAEDRS
ncbi:MAG: Fe-S protein assembly co-chaperone HscB [Acidobacteria bacterium]|nr:Fe-S protein assembly co-chaperone HscB [Acidobacteriota bacterium]